MARLQSGGRVGRRSGPSARASAAARPRPAPAARQDEKAEPRLSRLVRLRPDPIAELEEKGRGIRDPVEKLRFLRRSLERYERVDQKLQAVPGAPLRWLAYRGGPAPQPAGTVVLWLQQP